MSTSTMQFGPHHPCILQPLRSRAEEEEAIKEISRGDIAVKPSIDLPPRIGKRFPRLHLTARTTHSRARISIGHSSHYGVFFRWPAEGISGLACFQMQRWR